MKLFKLLIVSLYRIIQWKGQLSVKMDIIRSSPYAEIIEQPASNDSRFRYKCEYKTNPIHGVNSTPEKKTFPSIRISNKDEKQNIFGKNMVYDKK